MAQVVKQDSTPSVEPKGWLRLADEVRHDAVAEDSYRHAPAPEASVERLRELAGVIKLHGLAPSQTFLGDDGDDGDASSCAGC